MKWLKPTVAMTNHQHIVANFKLETDEEESIEIGLLSFNGIQNRWRTKDGYNEIQYKQIISYIPVPAIYPVSEIYPS